MEGSLHCFTAFYIRDLNISGFWYLQGFWNQAPADSKGQLLLRFEGVKSYMWIFGCAGVSALNSHFVPESTVYRYQRVTENIVFSASK